MPWHNTPSLSYQRSNANFAFVVIAIITFIFTAILRYLCEVDAAGIPSPRLRRSAARAWECPCRVYRSTRVRRRQLTIGVQSVIPKVQLFKTWKPPCGFKTVVVFKIIAVIDPISRHVRDPVVARCFPFEQEGRALKARGCPSECTGMEGFEIGGWHLFACHRVAGLP